MDALFKFVFTGSSFILALWILGSDIGLKRGVLKVIVNDSLKCSIVHEEFCKITLISTSTMAAILVEQSLYHASIVGGLFLVLSLPK